MMNQETQQTQKPQQTQGIPKSTNKSVTKIVEDVGNSIQNILLSLHRKKTFDQKCRIFIIASTLVKESKEDGTEEEYVKLILRCFYSNNKYNIMENGCTIYPFEYNTQLLYKEHMTSEMQQRLCSMQKDIITSGSDMYSIVYHNVLDNVKKFFRMKKRKISLHVKYPSDESTNGSITDTAEECRQFHYMYLTNEAFNYAISHSKSLYSITLGKDSIKVNNVDTNVQIDQTFLQYLSNPQIKKNILDMVREMSTYYIPYVADLKKIYKDVVIPSESSIPSKKKNKENNILINPPNVNVSTNNPPNQNQMEYFNVYLLKVGSEICFIDSNDKIVHGEIINVDNHSIMIIPKNK